MGFLHLGHETPSEHIGTDPIFFGKNKGHAADAKWACSECTSDCAHLAQLLSLNRLHIKKYYNIFFNE